MAKKSRAALAMLMLDPKKKESSSRVTDDGDAPVGEADDDGDTEGQLEEAMSDFLMAVKQDDTEAMAAAFHDAVELAGRD